MWLNVARTWRSNCACSELCFSDPDAQDRSVPNLLRTFCILRRITGCPTRNVQLESIAGMYTRALEASSLPQTGSQRTSLLSLD